MGASRKMAMSRSLVFMRGIISNMEECPNAVRQTFPLLSEAELSKLGFRRRPKRAEPQGRICKTTKLCDRKRRNQPVKRFCSILNQLLQIFSRAEFEKIVRETGAERHARGFRSWDQFVAMLFSHLADA